MRIFNNHMNESIDLDGVALKTLMDAVESSFHIKSKNQFFIWARGELQNIFPHEVMVSFLHDIPGKKTYVDTFCGISVSDKLIDGMLCGDNGVMNKLMGAWKKSLCPLVMDKDSIRVAIGEGGMSTLEKEGIDHLVSHGMHDTNENVVSFFSFMRVPGDVGPHHARLLEVLVPYLHRAMISAVVDDHESGRDAQPCSVIITDREKEVLRWIQVGKSNWAIAAILGISPFTVKNHICKITRKLGVQTRGHAVSKAIELNII
ncbi:MAG: helix-turn-helix transcriptional regulator [Gammaproteobacteria bacterium]